MIIGRSLGWIITAVALMTAGAEILASLESGAYQGLAIGYLWSKIDMSSLNLSQAVIQRYVHPSLWDPAIVTILKCPAWIMLGILGPALSLLFRKRRPRDTKLDPA
tara:strand:+ start:80 stop:397 length:318 start_codon:yes stop_codon:yes gene_type:complete